MGMNLQYQAVPADSGLLELVRDLAERFPERCWAVGHIPYLVKYGTDRATPEDEPVLGEIIAWCDRAKAQYPGLELRYFEPGKDVGSWKFLLSATYRQHTRWPKPAQTDPRAWNDPTGAFDALVDIAFFGAPEIAPGVRAGQGQPVQYIMPATAADFGTCVATLEFSEMRPHLEEVLTKHHSDEQHVSDNRKRWMKAIAEFQSFWRETAECRDGVLVIYN